MVLLIKLLLVVTLIILNDHWAVWNDALVDLLEDRIKVLLIWLSIAVEVVEWLLWLVLWFVSFWAVFFLGKIGEAVQSLHWLVVNVDVLNLWLSYCIAKSLFEHFLLIHLHLLLVFLNTYVHTMNHDILVDN